MEIISKEFNNFKVRIIILEGKEWFVAKDIAEILKYKKTANAIKDHCKNPTEWKELNKVIDSMTFKLHPQSKLILESDVWRLIIRSEMPEAEKIEQWIMEDVLPSIRKTGSYSISENSKDIQPNISKIQEMNSLGFELIRLANTFGFQGNQAYLSADKGVKNITGFSPLKLLDSIHLQAESKSKILTPTQIGKEIEKSAMETNLLLANLGFQEKIGKEWHILEKGLEFSELLDTNKKHSDGTPVKQIKWKKEIVEILQKSLDSGNSSLF